MFEDTSGMDSVHCSFCGKSQDEVKKIVAARGFTSVMNVLPCAKKLLTRSLKRTVRTVHLRFQHLKKS